MTATISDVVLSGVVYQNVYSATGIVVGTSLVLQNKSASTVYLQISTTSPDSSSRAGYHLYAGQEAYITNASEGLWAFGTGKIHVAIA